MRVFTIQQSITAAVAHIHWGSEKRGVENWLTFDDVIAKIRHHVFFQTQCIITFAKEVMFHPAFVYLSVMSVSNFTRETTD